MTTRVWGEECRTTTVCIDSYEDGILCGRFFNPYLDSGKSFKSLSHFLLEMEDTLDQMNFPQSFTAVRTFNQYPESSHAPPESEIPRGERATFTVRVLFRQNASWQGSVTWLEAKKEQSFRSALELILLIDSALKAS